MRTTVSKASGATYDEGLRGFFAYRDLGAREATGGGHAAHIIRAVPGEGPKPAWHTHDLGFQLVLVLQGWVRFEYADIGEVLLERGDSVVQPPGIPHREVAHSDDLEMLEVTSPAAFHTAETGVPPTPPA